MNIENLEKNQTRLRQIAAEENCDAAKEKPENPEINKKNYYSNRSTFQPPHETALQNNPITNEVKTEKQISRRELFSSIFPFISEKIVQSLRATNHIIRETEEVLKKKKL